MLKVAHIQSFKAKKIVPSNQCRNHLLTSYAQLAVGNVQTNFFSIEKNMSLNLGYPL